jgi:iron complex outermembrane receptor protein
MLVVLATGARAADDESQAKLPLDKLLETPISTAAKYDQQMSNVAASVTVITAEEIQRYGWTSLAEVLESVRGFYVTYDREAPYIGVRGVGRPTDYNSRLLILLDGFPVAEPVFGAAPAGNSLIDLAMVEKIEIIRGPGSALYGTHAMLAVINIFTKDADALDGTSVTATAGSFGRKGMAVRSGHQFANGMQITAAGFREQTRGANLYFPEYDTPETNHGVAEGRDYEDFHGFSLALRSGGLRLALSTRGGTKGIPTAMYDTVFNADEAMYGRQDRATLEYRRALAPNKVLEVRGFWDRGVYQGHYPYGDVGIDHSDTQTIAGEARFQWDLSPNQRFTAGTEYNHVRRLEYWYKIGDYTIDLQQPFDLASYYLQYEGHPSPRWSLVAGVRRDDFSATADSTNPRAGVIFTPNRSTSLKLLYGSAFRAPNIYEAYYSDPLTPWKAHPDLKPEKVRTTELVWEQRLSPDTQMVASAFHIKADGLIDQQLEPVDQVYWYNNVGSMDSNGVEVGVQTRRQNGLWTHFSGAVQRTNSDGQPATNSPQLLLKGGLSTSPWAPWHAGVEGIFEASRRTRDGERTDPFFLLNGTVSRQLGERIRLVLTSRNLLNSHYSLPVGPELRPQSIRQDGRTLALRLTYSR